MEVDLRKTLFFVFCVLYFQIHSVWGWQKRMSGRSSRQEPDLPFPLNLHAEVQLPPGRGS